MHRPSTQHDTFYHFCLALRLNRPTLYIPRDSLYSQSELGAFKVFTPTAISMGTAAADAMRRPRPKRVKRRIDAAIDHLAQYGFAEPQIRNIINNLLQLAVAPLPQKSCMASCHRVA